MTQANVVYDEDRQLFRAYVGEKKIAQSNSFAALETNLVSAPTGKKAKAYGVKELICTNFTREWAYKQCGAVVPDKIPQVGDVFDTIRTDTGIQVTLVDCYKYKTFQPITPVTRNQLMHQAYSLHNDLGWSITKIVDHMVDTYPHSRQQIVDLVNRAI